MDYGHHMDKLQPKYDRYRYFPKTNLKNSAQSNKFTERGWRPERPIILIHSKKEQWSVSENYRAKI